MKLIDLLEYDEFTNKSTFISDQGMSLLLLLLLRPYLWRTA